MTSAFSKLMGGLNEVESYLSGDGKGFQVHVPDAVDVKSIRQNLHMTQAEFSKTFGFSLDAVKHWEGNRRTPEIRGRVGLVDSLGESWTLRLIRLVRGRYGVQCLQEVPSQKESVLHRLNVAVADCQGALRASHIHTIR